MLSVVTLRRVSRLPYPRTRKHVARPELADPEVLRRLDAEIEIAVVDRAHFAADGTERVAGLGLRVLARARRGTHDRRREADRRARAGS